MIAGIPMEQFIVFALVAVGIFTFYMAAVALLKKDTLRERMLKVTSTLPGDEKEEERSPFFEVMEVVLARLGASTEKTMADKDLYMQLQRAGMHSRDEVVLYLLLRAIVQPVCLLIGIWVLFQTVMHPPEGFGTLMQYYLVAGIFSYLGISGTRMFITRRKNNRQMTMQLSFPDALDLLLVCIESGLALDGALNRVCRELKEAHPLITSELDRTRIELSVLGDRVQALQNLAERTDMVAFRSLVSSLLQTEKFGTSLSDTLRVLSEDYRLTRLMVAENKAARLPALITIPLIFFIMPSFMMIVLGPPLVQMEMNGGMFGEGPKMEDSAKAMEKKK